MSVNGIISAPNAELRRTARLTLRKAMSRGILQRPKACSVCGACPKFEGHEVKIVAHHPDYAKPLWIRWLCIDCHQVAHSMGRREMSAVQRRAFQSDWKYWIACGVTALTPPAQTETQK